MDATSFRLDDEGETQAERLALNLAREDQQLVVKLIETRLRMGLSQEQVADRIGVTQATISAFERLGNDPHMSTLRRYARALGVMVRHHVDDSADCTGSQALWHVSNSGITTQETAEALAVQRGLRRGGGSSAPPSWAKISDTSTARTVASGIVGAR